MSNYNYIRQHTDLTNLDVTATRDGIDRLCKRAVNYKVASVCVAPCWVEYIKKNYPGLRICTVIGFPNGYSSTEVKLYEIVDASTKGAKEVDLVVNTNWLMSDRNYSDGENYQLKLENEIKLAVKCCKELDLTLKVIFEICNLNHKQISDLCAICKWYGVEYVKTSTGFGKSGADIETVRMMKNLSEPCKVKAAGGIRTAKAAEEYLIFSPETGLSNLCDRVGASARDVVELKNGETVHITKMRDKYCDVYATVSHKYGDTFMLTDTSDPSKWYAICDYDDSFEVVED